MGRSSDWVILAGWISAPGRIILLGRIMLSGWVNRWEVIQVGWVCVSLAG